MEWTEDAEKERKINTAWKEYRRLGIAYALYEAPVQRLTHPVQAMQRCRRGALPIATPVVMTHPAGNITRTIPGPECFPGALQP